MKRSKDSLGFGVLLNLLFPGAGHFYWREYAFGTFIFLILLMAAALFFVSYLAYIPTALRAVLFVLPAVFYLFTFVDLARSIKKRTGGPKRTHVTAVIFLLLAIVFQAAAPITPTNFVWRNMPEMYRADDNHLAPMLRSGDIAWTNPLAYQASLFFLEMPAWHALPERGELVRFVARDSSLQTGLVLGLGDEEVEVVEGRLMVGGFPHPLVTAGNLRLSGDMPLTLVDPNSILVANLNLGAIDQTLQVPLEYVTGRVSRLF